CEADQVSARILNLPVDEIDIAYRKLRPVAPAAKFESGLPNSIWNVYRKNQSAIFIDLPLGGSFRERALRGKDTHICGHSTAVHVVSNEGDSHDPGLRIVDDKCSPRNEGVVGEAIAKPVLRSSGTDLVPVEVIAEQWEGAAAWKNRSNLGGLRAMHHQKQVVKTQGRILRSKSAEV